MARKAWKPYAALLLAGILAWCLNTAVAPLGKPAAKRGLRGAGGGLAGAGGCVRPKAQGRQAGFPGRAICGGRLCGGPVLYIAASAQFQLA